MSACGARGGVRYRPDVGEHAAGVPGWEGSYERRVAVELDAALARGLGPCELAGVPFDEGFGFRRDVEVLVEAVVRLADLCVSELDEEPIALRARAAGEVEADDDASIREPVSAERVAERLGDREEVVAGRREVVVGPAPVGLGCRVDDTEPFELLEAL